jgi:hypothetical protein
MAGAINIQNGVWQDFGCAAVSRKTKPIYGIISESINPLNPEKIISPFFKGGQGG